jgi:nucleoporin NUP159
LAIGLQTGDILAYDPTTKTVPKQHLPPTHTGRLISLTWLGPGYTFRVTYGSETLSDLEPVLQLIFCNASSMCYANLTPPFPSGDRQVQASHIITLPKWEGTPSEESRYLVVVGDISAVDLEILGIASHNWFQALQENPLSIPLDKNDEDTILVGMDVDLTDTTSNQPILLAYINDGTLQAWYMNHPSGYVGMVQSTPATSSVMTPPLPSAPVSLGLGALSAPTPPAAQTSAFGQPSGAFGAQKSPSPFGQSSAFGSTSSFGSTTNTFSSSFSGSGGFSGFANGSNAFTQQAASATPPSHASDSLQESSMDADEPSSFEGMGGLSLGSGGNSEDSKAKASIFGQPAPLPLPPDHPVNQSPPAQPTSSSAFGGGNEGGGFIKSGFGAFGGTGFGQSSPFASAGTSGSAFGSNTSTGAFGTNAASSSGAFGGNTGNGATFIKPGTGFGATMDASSPFAPKSGIPPTNSMFGAGAQALGSGAAASQAGSSALGQPKFGESGFGAQPKFGQSGFGSGFGQVGFGFGQSGMSQAKPASVTTSSGGGAFDKFASSGPTKFGGTSDSRPEQPAESLSSTDTTALSGNAAASQAPSPFGGFASLSPFTAASKPTNASTSGTSVLGSQPSSSPSPFSAQSSIFASTNSTTPKTEPQPDRGMSDSPPSSPEATALEPVKGGEETPTKATPFSTPFASSNAEKPTSVISAGFGAFANLNASDSPFLKNVQRTPPAISAFGGSSPFGSPSSPSLAGVGQTSATPTFGQTSMLGAAKSAFSSGPTTPTPPAKEPASGGFAAYTGTKSAFGSTKATQSFSELMAKDRNELKKGDSGPVKKEPTEQDSKAASSSPVKESEVKPEPTTSRLGQQESTGSISSQGSFVKVSPPRGSSEHGKSDSEQDAEGSAEEEDDVEKDPDYEPRSESDEESDDYEDGARDDEVDSFLSSERSHSAAEDDFDEEEEEEAEPSNIPLPASRSSSATPAPESPGSDASDSSGRLSTIPEETTTPPGTPEKPKEPKETSVATPTPTIFGNKLGLGLGRPSTRPARSSPLATAPLSPEAEEEEEEEGDNAEKRPPSLLSRLGGLTPAQPVFSTPESSKVKPGQPSASSVMPPPAAGLAEMFAKPFGNLLDGPVKAFTDNLESLKPQIEQLAKEGKLFAPGTDPLTLKATPKAAAPMPASAPATPSSSAGLGTPKAATSAAPAGAATVASPSIFGNGPGLSFPNLPKPTGLPTGATSSAPPGPGIPSFFSKPSPPIQAPSTPSPSTVARAVPVQPPQPSPEALFAAQVAALEDGMQKECAKMYLNMNRELDMVAVSFPSNQLFFFFNDIFIALHTNCRRSSETRRNHRQVGSGYTIEKGLGRS